MLSSKETELLQKCFLFSGDDKETLSHLDAEEDFTLNSFSKGEIIFGDRGNGQMGILLSGKASALCDELSGSRLKSFSSGELFGAAGVFCGNCSLPFSKIEAMTACRVLFIEQKGVEKILYQNPEKSIEYIKFLSGRVEFLNRRIKTFTAREANCRVAKYILQNANERGICENINFSALAKSLDISRASLYRARNTFITEGAISVNGRTVTVLNREALENIN